MSNSTAFLPQSTTKNLTPVANSSASVNWSAVEEKYTDTLQVFNTCTAFAFLRWGIGAQTAVATDYPVPPIGTSGLPTNIRIPPGVDTVAAFIATGVTPAPIYCTRGDGGV
jgi:hypothetical protein